MSFSHAHLLYSHYRPTPLEALEVDQFAWSLLRDPRLESCERVAVDANANALGLAKTNGKVKLHIIKCSIVTSLVESYVSLIRNGSDKQSVRLESLRLNSLLKAKGRGKG
jgi:hypothetical protein